MRIRYSPVTRCTPEVFLGGLPAAHLLIGGPSCQPFSTNGIQNAWEDKRSETFVACIDAIVEQASRPQRKLFGFMLENVVGLTMKFKDMTAAPSEEVLETLRESLGIGWEVWLWRVDSLHLGLPQHRARVYICGRRKDVFSRPLPVWSPERMRINGFSLWDALDPDLPETTPSSDRMKEDLKWYLEKARDARCHLPRDAVLVCDLSRSASASREPMYALNFTVTLTTGAKYLWVQGLAEDMPQYKRYLTVEERCVLQGFDPGLADRLTKACHVKALGNAMSVPVVGICAALLLGDFKGLA